MRIAWLTPFSVNSAVGKFSRSVVEALTSAAIDVVLCHFDSGEILATSARVLECSSAEDFVARAREQFELIVYNLGNHLPYHKEIFRASRILPGVCILHDFVMHHFFAEYCREHLRNWNEYSVLMERLYGSAGRAFSESGIRDADEVLRFPMFEEAIRGARGVVVHSEFFRQKVVKAFGGPACRIPLAYSVPQSDAIVRKDELGIAADAVLIVTVGHVNPNKRVDDVIRALGRIRAERVIEYAVIGLCGASYQHHLQELAEEHGLAEHVRLLGHVPDGVLRSYLECADICVNLRYPNFEGASASVIEQMLLGKPVIVNDTGFFSELPEDCVARVSPLDERELAAELDRLIIDANLRARLGTQARDFAAREYRSEQYAAAILDFGWEVRSAVPLLDLADKVAGELNRMGVTPAAEIVDVLSDHLHSVFCSETEDLPFLRA
jgi:glycosyltransferase involved in cell wall biosynthesis